MLEHFWIINNNNYRVSNYSHPFGIGVEINTFAHVFQLNFMNSKGLEKGNFYLTHPANGLTENLDLGLPLLENLILKTMKKQILSILFITVISLGFSQDFKINSEESIIEFNYVSEEAVGTIKGVSGKIHLI